MDWMNKQIINPSHLSLSLLPVEVLRAWTRASSLLNVKWCNLLSGGDKLVVSVAVMFPISHDVRRPLFLCLPLCSVARVEDWDKAPLRKCFWRLMQHKDAHFIKCVNPCTRQTPCSRRWKSIKPVTTHLFYLSLHDNHFNPVATVKKNAWQLLLRQVRIE